MIGQDEVSAVPAVEEEKGQNLNTHGVAGGGSSVKALQEKLLLKKNVPPPPPLVIPRRREKPLVFIQNGTRSHSATGTGTGTKRSPQNARTMQELVELRSKKLAQFIQTQFTTMAERNAAMRGAEEAILAQLREKHQLQQQSQQGFNLNSKEVISKLDQIYLNLRQEQAIGNKKIRQYKEGLIHQHSYTVTTNTTANKANATRATIATISSSPSATVTPSPLPPQRDTPQGDDHSADDAAGHYLASSTSAAATFLDCKENETTLTNVLPSIPSDHTLLHHEEHVDSTLLPIENEMDTIPCWLPTVLAQDEDAAIRRAEEMVRQMAQEVDWWETTTVSSNTSYFLDELSEVDDDISTLSPFTTNTITNSIIHDKTIHHGFQKESSTLANYQYATPGTATATATTMPSLKDEEWIAYWSEDHQREYFYNTRTQKVAWFIPSSAEKNNKETVPEVEDEENCNNTQNKSFIYDDGTVDDSELVPVKDYTKKIVQTLSTETEQQDEQLCSSNAPQCNTKWLTLNRTIVVTLLVIPLLVSRYCTGDCRATFLLQLKHASKELVSSDNTLPTKNQDNKLNVFLEHEVVDEASPVEKQRFNSSSVSSSTIKPKKRILPMRKEKRQSSKKQNIIKPSLPSKAAAAPATKPVPSIVKDIPPSLASVVTEEPGCIAVPTHALSHFSFTYDVMKSTLPDVKSVVKSKEKEFIESTISLSATELMNARHDWNSGQQEKVKKNNANVVKRPKGCYIPLSWLISSHCRLLAKQEPLFDVNSPDFMKY